MSLRVQKDTVCDSIATNAAVSQLTQTQSVVGPQTLSNSSFFPANTFNTVGFTFTTGSTLASERFVGGVLAPNGKVYGIPYFSSGILEVTPEFPSLQPWMLAPEFNKF